MKRWLPLLRAPYTPAPWPSASPPADPAPRHDEHTHAFVLRLMRRSPGAISPPPSTCCRASGRAPAAGEGHRECVASRRRGSCSASITCATGRPALPAWPDADHGTRLVFIVRGLERDVVDRAFACLCGQAPVAGLMPAGRSRPPSCAACWRCCSSAPRSFAAAHAVGHLGELSALAGAGAGASAAQADYEGGVPDAERHASCLLCLAAADLSVCALPSPPALLASNPAPPLPGGEPTPAPAAGACPARTVAVRPPVRLTLFPSMTGAAPCAGRPAFSGPIRLGSSTACFPFVLPRCAWPLRCRCRPRAPLFPLAMPTSSNCANSSVSCAIPTSSASTPSSGASPKPRRGPPLPPAPPRRPAAPRARPARSVARVEAVAAETRAARSSRQRERLQPGGVADHRQQVHPPPARPVGLPHRRLHPLRRRGRPRARASRWANRAGLLGQRRPPVPRQRPLSLAEDDGAGVVEVEEGRTWKPWPCPPASS